MKTSFDISFGTDWKNLYVDYREGFYTSVVDFHKHDFYEVNLILSGNVKILLSDISEHTHESRIVLTSPSTPHFTTCESDTLYSRLYLLFSKEFLQDFMPEWKRLETVFGQNGNILRPNHEQRDFCKNLILQIDKEFDLFRQKLLVLYLLSYLCEIPGSSKMDNPAAPPYIIEALSFIESHYNEKITAVALSDILYIGRTTLMTNFKKYTGSTLNDYIIATRLKKAIAFLHEGKTEQETAELCGFSDTGNLIRNFKRFFEMTPRQYMAKSKTP